MQSNAFHKFVKRAPDEFLLATLAFHSLTRATKHRCTLKPFLKPNH